jgi:hypothetical protein
VTPQPAAVGRIVGHAERPLLLTLRSRSEMGSSKALKNRRLGLFQPLLAGAQARFAPLAPERRLQVPKPLKH